jgi:hypothetical protein
MLPLECLVVGVLDMPVSLLADTVCLPYTIYRTMAEPRKIAIRHISREDGGPAWILESDVPVENRRMVPAREVCTVVRAVQGKPKSVEAVLMADNSVPTSEFKLIYEIILSNPTLTVLYTHNAIETNFMEVCYPDKKDRSNHERVSRARAR